jgi:septal ring-binding cell division protein DamX
MNMANGPNQRVVPYGKKWAVKAQGSERATATFDTKEEALQRARQIAKRYGSKVLAHRENGTMQTSGRPTKSSEKRRLVDRKTPSKTVKKKAVKKKSVKKKAVKKKAAKKKDTTRAPKKTSSKPARRKKGFLARLFKK